MNPASRPDLYAPIHKALRALMADLVVAVGRMDPADDADARATIGRVLEDLALCEEHMRLEDTILHPALEARRPGATARAAFEHAGHVAEFAELRTAIADFLDAGASGRRELAHPLYLRMARWAANNYLHMEHEEAHHGPALLAAFGDAELGALHARILAAIPADAMPKYLRWLQSSGAMRPAAQAA